MKQRIGQAPSLAYPNIKALSDVMKFGKYKGQTVDWIMRMDADYILWLSDEKIVHVSKKILEHAEEISIEQRFDEVMDGELRGMRFWEIFGDDD